MEREQESEKERDRERGRGKTSGFTEGAALESTRRPREKEEGGEPDGLERERKEEYQTASRRAHRTGSSERRAPRRRSGSSSWIEGFGLRIGGLGLSPRGKHSILTTFLRCHGRVLCCVKAMYRQAP